MKKLPKLFLPVTLLAGIVCGFLRNEMYVDAQGDPLGLIPLHHPNYPIIYGLAAVVAVLLIVYRFAGPKRPYQIVTKLPIAGIGAGFGALACAYMLFKTEGSTLMLVAQAMGLFGFWGLATAYFAGKRPSLLNMLLPVFMCFGMVLGNLTLWSKLHQTQDYLFDSLFYLFTAIYGIHRITAASGQKADERAGFVWGQAALFCAIVAAAYGHILYFVSLSLWLLSTFFITPCKMVLPAPAERLIKMLERAGYTAYAVGGCVRDGMLGRTPKDYDLCTNAKPEEIAKVFDGYELVKNGEKHGTVGVVVDQTLYEITTYRTEGGYEDSRHPDWVEFVDNVCDDLARRDFTVNAMAFNPAVGYIDPYGGQSDLFGRTLRAVGDPQKRFTEDALRILRGVRFACRFRLVPQKDTLKEMIALAPTMDRLASERVFSELNEILCHIDEGDLLLYKDVLLQVLPELAPCVNFCQHSRHHRYDVLRHTEQVLCNLPADAPLRWAALLHDISKPQTFARDEKGEGHFHGHAAESARVAEQILLRLKAPAALREEVVTLIAHHMDLLTPEKPLLRRRLSKYGEPLLKKMIDLQTADRIATGYKKEKHLQDRQKLLGVLKKLTKEEGRLEVKDLAIDGHDLIALGFTEGPQIGQVMNHLLQQVLDGKLPNDHETLKAAAAEFLKNQ